MGVFCTFDRFPDYQPGSNLPFGCVDIFSQQGTSFTDSTSTEQTDTEQSAIVKIRVKTSKITA